MKKCRKNTGEILGLLKNTDYSDLDEYLRREKARNKRPEYGHPFISDNDTLIEEEEEKLANFLQTPIVKAFKEDEESLKSVKLKHTISISKFNKLSIKSVYFLAKHQNEAPHFYPFMSLKFMELLLHVKIKKIIFLKETLKKEIKKKRKILEELKSNDLEYQKFQAILNNAGNLRGRYNALRDLNRIRRHIRLYKCSLELQPLKDVELQI